MAISQIAFDFDAPTEAPLPKKVSEKAVASRPVAVTIPVSKNKSPRGRKSLTDANAMADRTQVPPDEQLFSKSYYSMGEVAAMFNITLSLIRLWENEFDVLRPRKNGKGDRLFRPEDIKSLQLIHHLLRERKYTMQGAKEFLKKNKQATDKFELIEGLKRLKHFLLELKAGL
jgi:DNA-binding transcriptional MerR regulator